MDYEGMILAAQDAREIAEDEPDYDPALTCCVALRTTIMKTVRIVIIEYLRS